MTDTPRPPIGATPSTQVPRYAGKSTFARIADIHEVSDYDIAVVGLPFDGGTSYRPGARFGPMAVRQAARTLRPGYHVEFGVAPLEQVQIVDAGDVTITPFDISEACTQIENGMREIIGDRGRRVVAIGGDHTVALPNLRALHSFHGPLALVHFDAHLDTWDTYFNAPVTHGTPFRRAFEEGLLIEDHSIHVGIRGPIYDRMDLEDDARWDFGSSGPATSTSWASRQPSTSSPAASPICRCISRSTSTFLTPPSRPGPGHPSRAG